MSIVFFLLLLLCRHTASPPISNTQVSPRGRRNIFPQHQCRNLPEVLRPPTAPPSSPQKDSRHKGWWREGKDELATHSMTTEVWISTRGRISEATRIALQEALEEDNKKDIPSFGKEDLEEIHRSATEAGLLGIYNFPGSVYATDGSNDNGVMGAGFFKLYEHRGGCCQLGRGEEGNSSNRAELGAACLALEDAKRQQDRKPEILLSDSACFLSSSQKWTGEGKSPSMHGNPDADIMRDIIQLLRERMDQGLLTIFIKIKAHR